MKKLTFALSAATALAAATIGLVHRRRRRCLSPPTARCTLSTKGILSTSFGADRQIA